jgi:hypothetical protein
VLGAAHTSRTMSCPAVMLQIQQYHTAAYENDVDDSQNAPLCDKRKALTTCTWIETGQATAPNNVVTIPGSSNVLLASRYGIPEGKSREKAACGKFISTSYIALFHMAQITLAKDMPWLSLVDKFFVYYRRT